MWLLSILGANDQPLAAPEQTHQHSVPITAVDSYQRRVTQLAFLGPSPVNRTDIGLSFSIVVIVMAVGTVRALRDERFAPVPGRKHRLAEAIWTGRDEVS